MVLTINDLKKELRENANKEKAKLLQGFFKTGKGEYGEGDVFLGIVVPVIRNISKKYLGLGLDEIKVLLHSKIHEERLCSLFILVQIYGKNASERKEIFDFYLENAKFINNWDLVDLSAPKIAGHFLYHFGKDYPLYKILLTNLAASDNLWEKRISILSTFYFIKMGEFEKSLDISKILLEDKHDLIHKAVGWMLREIGKKDQTVEESFLKKHYKKMPRTMLRYAIERFEEEKRKRYLEGKI